MRKGIIAVAVAAAFSPAAVMAADISYTYGEVDYMDADFGPVSANGFGLQGSFEVADNFHVGVGYSSIGFPLGLSLDRTTIGFGYHSDLGSDASFFANLNYEDAELLGLSENGYSVEVGIRAMVGNNFELQGQIGQIDLDGSELFYGAAARYWINDDMAVGIEYETVDTNPSIDVLSIGFRYNFGG
jgi:hypothetical protein